MTKQYGRLSRRQLAFMYLAGLALLAGCASVPPYYTTQTKDPWEKMNRITFAFNQKFDKAIARPLAKTYVRAVPKQARSGIHDFFNNLDEPVTIVNDALQGQIKQTLKDTGRFLINSTFGLLGWFDVARHVGLPDHDADLGETLAHWGVPSGPYLVIPLLGPSSVRDASAMYPDYYANPIRNNMQTRYRNAGALLNGIDTRAGFLDLDSTIDSAYDPYIFVRDAWIQHRRYQIYNGNPPMEYPSYPDLPSDDGASDNNTPAAASSTVPAAMATTAPPANATHDTVTPAAASRIAPAAVHGLTHVAKTKSVGKSTPP